MIAGRDGEAFWHSASLTGRDLQIVEPQPPGERRFRRLALTGMELYAISFGVAWEDYAGNEARYTFAVAEDTAVFDAEIESFRTTLWSWLGGMAAVLLLAQGFILRWGLRPLRTVAADLRRIEQGGAEHLEGHYPKELVGLTSSLNSLIEHSKAVQTRYRNSLDDLAHSLKTPLAILQSLGEGKAGAAAIERSILGEQVERMDEIISHQLQRAAVSGRALLARSVPVAPVVERLVHSLDKVYAEKGVTPELDLEPGTRFHGDEADLIEILGNLLENAYKYCRGRIRVCARPPPGASADGLEISIEDDGNGIAPDTVDTVLQRGQRLDQTVPGHGIGLSMASEIIALYGGRLEFATSDLGGALLRAYFGSHSGGGYSGGGRSGQG
jgi:two-component system sensor histidine kinase PhoQ